MQPIFALLAIFQSLNQMISKYFYNLVLRLPVPLNLFNIREFEHGTIGERKVEEDRGVGGRTGGQGKEREGEAE